MAPTYRERLRVEGYTLAACGIAGSAALLVFRTEQATRGPLSTVVQLAVVGALLAWLGPRSARRSMEASDEVAPGAEGSGEPTPLWHLPLIVVGLAAIFAPVGWDAALRITGGCTLVGLAQAVLLERVVARDEERRGRVYFRRPGSRILRGTRLGHRSRG